MTKKCRRCSECPNSEHHWMENTSFGDPLDGIGEYICKHCSIQGTECVKCGGQGTTDEPDELCGDCGGELVNVLYRLN